MNVTIMMDNGACRIKVNGAQWLLEQTWLTFPRNKVKRKKCVSLVYKEAKKDPCNAKASTNNIKRKISDVKKACA